MNFFLSQQQQSKLHAQASSTQQSEELEDQEFFVPLRQIGKKKALKYIGLVHK